MAAQSVRREQLDRFVELRNKRRKLNSDAALLEKEEKAIAEDLRAAATAAGGHLKRFGFLIRLIERAGRVAWQEAFIRANGAEAAAKLKNSAEPEFVLDVSEA